MAEETCPDYTATTAVECSFNETTNTFTANDINSLVNFKYDNFVIDNSDSLKDVYTYRLGTTVVGTIELVYNNTTKEDLISGARL